MNDSVDGSDVRHVAELARLSLADEEVHEFAEQFADVLDWFDALDDVPEIEQEAGGENVLRPDEIREGLTRGEALRNAPETEDGFVKGPPVS